MLEITICMTILKELLGTELLDASIEEREIAEKILQHKIVLSYELNKGYIEYCEKNSIDKDRVQNFLAKICCDREHCRILNAEEQQDRFKTESNSYLRILKNTCYGSVDRVLLSEHSKLNANILQSEGIELIRKDEMEIENNRNLFTKYTFPIISYQIKEKECSKELASWIGRILQQEQSFVIYDNYFAGKENIKNFQKYILKYIPKGAEIVIVTTETESIKKGDIVSAIATQDYSMWNLEVYLAKSKKENHPRAIITPTYSIYLDRGISTFGRGGETFSSLLSIKKNKECEWYRQQVGEKIFP